MAEMDVSVEKQNKPRKMVPANVSTFAEQIESEANKMAQGGWLHEATDLRKWASELRVRALRSGVASDSSTQLKK